MFKFEDGTGVIGANSYAEVSFADSYFSLRGNETWLDLDQVAKESALIKASEYIDARFGSRLQTPCLKAEQGLQFPKRFFITPNHTRIAGVPDVWRRAVCEYAFIATTKDLFGNNDTGEPVVQSKETSVGPITTKTAYAVTTAKAFPSYPKPDNLALSLFTRSNGVIR